MREGLGLYYHTLGVGPGGVIKGERPGPPPNPHYIRNGQVDAGAAMDT